LLPIPARGRCDVWQVPLAQAPQDLALLEPMLSPAERQRAAAFLLPAPRRQFVLARAALRTLLARYLALAPSAFSFVLNAHGKPALPAPAPLRFNVSHAGEFALVAIAGEMEVGVDVEVHRRVDDLDSLAASILCREDLERWRAAAAAEGAAAFYRIWTCKEAAAKAIGCGMAMDFRALRIDLAPGRAATLAALAPGWGRAEDCALRELESANGYSAAVAACAPALQVTQRAFVW